MVLKLAKLPEIFALPEVHKEDLFQRVVDVGEHVVFRPFETELMITLAVVGQFGGVALRGSPERVVFCGRAYKENFISFQVRGTAIMDEVNIPQ